ncbi:MAG: GNAT family N-acetyltransferase [Planctomycetota bacterium]|nr:GNAT family N-acetyltransferase [Planctomycetota bacterium]
MAKATPKITIRPLTPNRWDDLVTLFGSRGACGGCWCMTPRLKRKDFETGKGAKNRRRFRDIVKRSEEPGVLAYLGRTPIGWCGIAPREVFIQLSNSRVLKPIDDQPVWSVTCLFIEKEYRRRGVSSALLEGAVKFARRKGARIIEGYPVLPRKGDMPDAFAWMGLPGSFEKAGFVEAHRHSPNRPIMRCHVG